MSLCTTHHICQCQQLALSDCQRNLIQTGATLTALRAVLTREVLAKVMFESCGSGMDYNNNSTSQRAWWLCRADAILSIPEVQAIVKP